MNGPHSSHVTRISDASTFDEICVNCGAHDEVPGGWGRLAYPCSEPMLSICRCNKMPVHTIHEHHKREQHHASCPKAWPGDPTARGKECSCSKKG